jgi:hypothetical protein
VRLGMALKELHQAEITLAQEYRTVGERHAAEHDIFHACTTLAKQCHTHAEQLRPVAARYDEQLPEQDPQSPGRGCWAGCAARARN